jgi:hypothetical protein
MMKKDSHPLFFFNRFLRFDCMVLFHTLFLSSVLFWGWELTWQSGLVSKGVLEQTLGMQSPQYLQQTVIIQS